MREREGERERARERMRPAVPSPPQTCGAAAGAAAVAAQRSPATVRARLGPVLPLTACACVCSSVMSLLGAYKKKSTYDGYECLQLVDSGRDSLSVGRGSSSGSGTRAGSSAATIGQKAGPLREDNYSTMDSSGRAPHTPPIWNNIKTYSVK